MKIDLVRPTEYYTVYTYIGIYNNIIPTEFYVVAGSSVLDRYMYRQVSI